MIVDGENEWNQMNLEMRQDEENMYYQKEEANVEMLYRVVIQLWRRAKYSPMAE